MQAGSVWARMRMPSEFGPKRPPDRYQTIWLYRGRRVAQRHPGQTRYRSGLAYLWAVTDMHPVRAVPWGNVPNTIDLDPPAGRDLAVASSKCVGSATVPGDDGGVSDRWCCPHSAPVTLVHTGCTWRTGVNMQDDAARWVSGPIEPALEGCAAAADDHDKARDA
ncbi:hypothetical protein A3649_00565 [Mycobacterium ulcerans]|nr:hypothetical protein A3649_00565 [Mycobacterium ulcerans]